MTYTIGFHTVSNLFNIAGQGDPISQCPNITEGEALSIIERTGGFANHIQAIEDTLDGLRSVHYHNGQGAL